jgi:hypothetical protein
MKGTAMRRTNSPKGLIPGGAVKKGRLIREDQLAGRGSILPCNSPALSDPRVLANFQRLCRAYPLRDRAAPLVASIATLEVELDMLQGKAAKTLNDRKQIHQWVVALGSALKKLTTMHLKPHEVMPQ